MERCYVCNHCGKCDDLAFRIVMPMPVCLDCGHEVQPGESPARCAACGGARIATMDFSEDRSAIARSERREEQEHE